jgi:hypothetical protein
VSLMHTYPKKAKSTVDPCYTLRDMTDDNLAVPQPTRYLIPQVILLLSKRLAHLEMHHEFVLSTLRQAILCALVQFYAEPKFVASHGPLRLVTSPLAIRVHPSPPRRQPKVLVRHRAPTLDLLDNTDSFPVGQVASHS